MKLKMPKDKAKRLLLDRAMMLVGMKFTEIRIWKDGLRNDLNLIFDNCAELQFQINKIDLTLPNEIIHNMCRKYIDEYIRLIENINPDDDLTVKFSTLEKQHYQIKLDYNQLAIDYKEAQKNLSGLKREKIIADDQIKSLRKATLDLNAEINSSSEYFKIKKNTTWRVTFSLLVLIFGFSCYYFNYWHLLGLQTLNNFQKGWLKVFVFIAIFSLLLNIIIKKKVETFIGTTLAIIIAIVGAVFSSISENSIDSKKDQSQTKSDSIKVAQPTKKSVIY